MKLSRQFGFIEVYSLKLKKISIYHNMRGKYENKIMQSLHFEKERGSELKQQICCMKEKVIIDRM